MGFQGRDFCAQMEGSARTNAVAHRTWGWIAGIGALAAAAAGAGVAASDQPDDSAAKNRYKVAVVTLPLASGALAYIASGQFSMSENSSSLGSTAAGTVGTDDDPAANKTCNSALATWDSDSTAASAAFASAVAQINQAKKDQDTAAKALRDAKKEQEAAAKALQKAKAAQDAETGPGATPPPK